MQDYLMYLRKSRQDNPNETIEEVLARHERQLQEYAIKTFGYRIEEENIYREIVSGETIDDRPEINRVFERMQNSNIKGVLVIEPQRLTRGDMLDCGTVVHIFRYTNTLIMTPNKTYNLEDKYDRKFFEMELSRGNDYLEYTKEILQRGRMASQREGNYISGTPPFGYDRVKIGKSWTLAINEKEAPLIKMAYEMYLNGHGTGSIANKFNELGAIPRKAKRFSKSTILQMIGNPVYTGKIKINFKPTERVYENGKLVKKRKRQYDCEIIQGKHPAIISDEIFQKAQEHKGLVTKEVLSLELQNPFAGIIRCKKCGASVRKHIFKKDGKEIRKSRYSCNNRKYCNCKSCNTEKVDKVILDTLRDYLNDFKLKIDINDSEIRKSHQDVINTLERELDKLENKQEELYTFLEDGIYTKEVFIKRNEKLANERERLQEALEKAKAYIPTQQEYIDKYSSLHEAIEMLENDTIPVKQKNNFLKKVIKVIYYDRDKDDRQNDENVRIEVILR